MKKEKLTVLFCQIGTAITYLSLKWFPLPLPLSVAFTKFIIFTYKDSYINQSATFHSDRTNLNIKREKCDFSFFNISIGHKLSLSLQNLIINPFNYMAFTNNIMIVRHRLLTELVKLWKNGELTTDKIDRLPLELSPRRSKHAGRCCVHKERAVWKYKSLPLLGLDMDDVDFKNNGIKVHRKGGADVIVYFGDEVRDALLSYWEERSIITPAEGHANALFLSLQRKRISVRSVENLVKKYSRLVTTVKNITPHKLRSTYGTTLYQETGDIYLVADVLGHKDVNTTRKHYAAQEDGRRRAAARVVHLRED